MYAALCTPMSREMFDELSKYPRTRLLEFSVPDMQLNFLADIGLPDWCAPNMHFGGLGEEWEFLPLIEAGGRRYLGLGEDRDDNPIGLDVENWSIWVVARQGPPLLMARSVFELSQALHQFQECINYAVESDHSAFTKNRIPQESFGPFISWALSKSPELLAVGSFWRGVLMSLGVHNNSLQARRP